MRQVIWCRAAATVCIYCRLTNGCEGPCTHRVVHRWGFSVGMTWGRSSPGCGWRLMYRVIPVTSRSSARAVASLALLLAAPILAGCVRSEPPAPGYRRANIDPRTGTSPSPRVAGPGQTLARGGGAYKVGAPYQVSGRWYYPRHQPDYDRTGIASWYGADFHGRKTANGEIFDMHALTAAHTTLPIPSYAYVTNLANGRTLLVRINDRGPFVGNRIIDLSKGTARALGLEGAGVGQVRVRYAGTAPLDGDTRQEWAYARRQPWWRSVTQQAEPARTRWPRWLRSALGGPAATAE